MDERVVVAPVHGEDEAVSDLARLVFEKLGVEARHDGCEHNRAQTRAPVVELGAVAEHDEDEARREVSDAHHREEGGHVEWRHEAGGLEDVAGQVREDDGEADVPRECGHQQYVEREALEHVQLKQLLVISLVARTLNCDGRRPRWRQRKWRNADRDAQQCENQAGVGPAESLLDLLNGDWKRENSETDPRCDEGRGELVLLVEVLFDGDEWGGDCHAETDADEDGERDDELHMVADEARQ